MSDPTNSAGSYAFGQFEENETELDRLTRQATIALDMERRIWSEAGLKPGMRVLDLACGPGLISCELARRTGSEGSVMGVDISTDLLGYADQVLESSGLTNVSFAQGDVFELDLPENSFDFVYARLLFQHLHDPAKALRNILRVMAPGGRLCILDVDDKWIMVQPECPEYGLFTELAGQGQATYGGDRNIGRRLPGLLNQVGYAEIRCDLEQFSSFDVGFKTFLEITTGFKLEQVEEEHKEEAQGYLETIYNLEKEPFRWGISSVFIVTGTKPE